MTDETRARFLSSIATHLPPDRIAEVHIFSAIKQGGMESGVAVVALNREPAPVSGDDGAAAEDEPAEAFEGEQADGFEAESVAPAERFTIYTARYRHTLKGIDRGKWEVSVTEEADAPLLTLDAVIRGVQKRSGDVDEIVRLSGDDVRAALEPAAATAV